MTSLRLSDMFSLNNNPYYHSYLYSSDIYILEGLFENHLKSKEHHKHIERFIHDLNEQGSMELID